MSMAAAAFASSSNPNSIVQFRITGNKILVNAVPTFRISSRPLTKLFLRNSCVYKRRSISTASIRRFSTVMEWQDCTLPEDLFWWSFVVETGPVQVAGSQISSAMDFFALKLHSSYRVKLEVDVPCSVAYKCYSDRESIPRWMPFISSVKGKPDAVTVPKRCLAQLWNPDLEESDPVFNPVSTIHEILEDKPDLSRWSLKYTAFGRDIEFSWLAQNFQPIPNQKIHWRSLEGLPNRGVVRFYPKGPSSCIVDLTVSYEVPQILVPVASALQPFLEQLLLRGLESFANVAKIY